MGVAVNLSLLCAFVLIVSVHYGSVYGGVLCEKSVPQLVVHNCPDDTYCCDTGNGCCPVFFTKEMSIAVTFFTVFLVMTACIMCCWCLFVGQIIKKWRGTVCTHEGVTVVSGGPCQNSPQGQPKAPFDPYPGIPPPEYQPSAPAYTVNPQVMPPAPIGFIPTATK